MEGAVMRVLLPDGDGEIFFVAAGEGFAGEAGALKSESALAQRYDRAMLSTSRSSLGVAG
jgi:hypothetical protein